MAVTVTYEHPVAGIVAPTAVEAKGIVNANVIATADGDTTATITHNFGLSADEIAAGWPAVVITPLLQAVAVVSAWAVTSVTTNTVVLTKGVGAGSGNVGAQLRVSVQRPHSIVR